jgi:hypothetical protein
MIYCKKIHGYFYLPLLLLLAVSCQKVDISFGASPSATDPNVTFFDNYSTSIATAKPDSFISSSHSVMSIGYHYDSVFGVVKAGSFAQISFPSTNPVLYKQVTFDSLELIIKPSGSFYGDSTTPMKINVYRLTQNIRNAANDDVYYNTTAFNYDPSAIGSQLVSLNGKTGTGIHIRLSNALGQEWLTKFTTNDDAISSAEKFVDYFRGIYVTSDSVVTKSLAYFNIPQDSMLIRMSYHENSIYAIPKQFDFSYTAAKQFNTISFRHTTTAFASFVNNKKQLIESTAAGNKAYLNNNLGSSIRITFPDLLNLKELHPYIKVVKAVLVIKPDVKSRTFPYQLPANLLLYTTDDTNLPLTGVYEPGTSSLLTGNLVVDQLYGENTYYSYDITGFINTKISDGEFSKTALLLYPSVTSFDGSIQRLIVDDQTNGKSVQLKLYVLGL